MSLHKAVAPFSRPRAPSTPGSPSLLDDEPRCSPSPADEPSPPSDPVGEPTPVGELRQHRQAAFRVSTLHLDPERFSVGGTALSGYDSFDASLPSANNICGRMPDVKPPAGAGLFPASTRALMLEERLREVEQRCQSLKEQNSALRREAAIVRQEQQQQEAHRTTLALTTSEGGTQTNEGSGSHPAFGRLVADLGFKKVYVASARAFVGSVPIWSKQRPCNEDRVAEIVHAKARAPHLMGPIMVFERTDAAAPKGPNGASVAMMPSLSCPQPVGIFDGQHRARAAMRLLASEDFSISDDEKDDDGNDETEEEGTGGGETSGRSSARLLAAAEANGTFSAGSRRRIPAMAATGGKHDDFEMLVEVYPVRSEQDVKRLYLEVNKGEVVKEIDLPDQLAPELKSFIDEAVATLLRRWPEMFKPSERCRPPHLHRDTLRNKLFQAHATHGATSAEALVAAVSRVNEALKARPISTWPERLRGKPMQKAKAHGCFLGLAEYSWLDMLGA